MPEVEHNLKSTYSYFPFHGNMLNRSSTSYYKLQSMHHVFIVNAVNYLLKKKKPHKISVLKYECCKMYSEKLSGPYYNYKSCLK